MTSSRGRSSAVRWLLAAALCGAAGVFAQGKKEFDYVGAPSCAKATTACHKKPTNQWKSVEPQTIGADAHYNTSQRLSSDPTSKKYLAKLKWPADDSRCTTCHATVVPNLARGRPTSGVSCESCHGAGSGYLDKHQEIPDVPTAYQESVGLGLADLRKGPPAIAPVCARCHVISDPQVVRAGHPTGDSWRADQALTRIVHWEARSHSPAALRTAVDALKATRLKGVSAVVADDVRPDTRPGTASPAPASPAPTPTPAGSLADIPLLPEGFEDVAPVATPRPLTGSGGRTVRRSVSPAADAPTDLTTTDGPAGVVETVATGSTQAPARSVLTEMVSLRRAVGELVLRLLERKAKGELAGPPPALDPASAEYAGPDGELLRLQDELLRLSLEALRREAGARGARP